MTKTNPVAGQPLGWANQPFPHTPGAFLETSGGVNVSASASTNTKGAWTQMIASTANECAFIMVQGGAIIATTGALLDIGVGAAGSEVVIVPNILVGATARSGGQNFAGMGLNIIPIRIPRGSRVAARVQATVGSTLSRTTVTLFGQQPSSMTSPRNVANMGSNTATSRAVAVTANNTWTEITSSTPQAFAGLIPSIQPNDQTTQNDTERLEVGIGASGAEVAIGACLFGCSSGGVLLAGTFQPIWRRIQAGTRLSVRSATAGTTNIDVALLGIPD